MASVFNKTTNQYIESANTPDFDPSEWIINPDVSDLQDRNVPEKFWKAVEVSPGIWGVQEFSSAEKSNFLQNTEELSLKNKSSVLPAVFSHTSTAKNRWLNTYGGISSNEVPFVVPADGAIKFLSYANERYDSDTRILIYRTPRNLEPDVSAELLHSETLYNVRTGVYTVNKLVSAGDKLAVFMEDIGRDVRGPVVILYMTANFGTLVDMEDNFNEDF